MPTERKETALNLRPGDEVQMDGQWWRVTEHNVDFRNAAPVTMQLHSRHDNMLMAYSTFPSQEFVYEPR